ncbi:MAG TPA: hypothetical protein VHL80_19110, partial [Polyangia bacterium]|nr:hypothetical protein [Polyangia bacterium]
MIKKGPREGRRVGFSGLVTILLLGGLTASVLQCSSGKKTPSQMTGAMAGAAGSTAGGAGATGTAGSSTGGAGDSSG